MTGAVIPTFWLTSRLWGYVPKHLDASMCPGSNTYDPRHYRGDSRPLYALTGTNGDNIHTRSETFMVRSLDYFT